MERAQYLSELGESHDSFMNFYIDTLIDPYRHTTKLFPVGTNHFEPAVEESLGAAYFGAYYTKRLEEFFCTCGAIIPMAFFSIPRVPGLP